MSAISEIPLESIYLGERAALLECFICGHENCQSSDKCRHCRAPMGISQQAADSATKPKVIAVLGPPGVGKTTYLGLLVDMLTRKSGGLEATARGLFSISLQQLTTTALAGGWFPEKSLATPEHWHWVYCQIHCRRRRKPVEIVFADIPGDALLEETESQDKYPAIRSILRQASGVMAITDAGSLHAGDNSNDFVTRKLLTLAQEEFAEPKRRFSSGRRTKRPLAFVLTKADLCESCFDNPTEWTEAHAESLLEDIRHRFPLNSVFPVSVAGACAKRDGITARVEIPLRVEPRGIVEPLGWLIGQL